MLKVLEINGVPVPPDPPSTLTVYVNGVPVKADTGNYIYYQVG